MHVARAWLGTTRPSDPFGCFVCHSPPPSHPRFQCPPFEILVSQKLRHPTSPAGALEVKWHVLVGEEKKLVDRARIHPRGGDGRGCRSAVPLHVRWIRDWNGWCGRKDAFAGLRRRMVDSSTIGMAFVRSTWLFSSAFPWHLLLPGCSVHSCWERKGTSRRLASFGILWRDDVDRLPPCFSSSSTTMAGLFLPCTGGVGSIRTSPSSAIASLPSSMGSCAFPTHPLSPCLCLWSHPLSFSVTLSPNPTG